MTVAMTIDEYRAMVAAEKAANPELRAGRAEIIVLERIDTARRGLGEDSHLVAEAAAADFTHETSRAIWGVRDGSEAAFYVWVVGAIGP